MPSHRDPQTLDLTIESIGFEGRSIAHHEGLVYFVAGGIPGDRVRVQVRKRKKRYAEAVVTEVLQAGEQRRDPPCDYFGDCGGCQWQHLDYAAQVRWKGEHVQDCFERLGKVSYGQLLPPIAARDPYGYRNKMEFSFGDRRWLTQEEIASGVALAKDFALGLHVPGRYDRILDIDHCHLQHPVGNKILQAVRQATARIGPTPYQTHSHTGLLRHLVIRTAQQGRETMVILVISPPQTQADQAMLDWFASDFIQQHPELTSVYVATTTSKAQVAGGELQLLHGQSTLTEYLMGLAFRISPFSFFQTNSQQAEQLLQVIRTAAHLQPTDHLWDLYCGTGTIGLCLASAVQHVWGIELVASAIADARLNAALNGITNIEFIQQDMTKADPILAQLPSPSVVIVDPPRAGLDAGTVERLLTLAPPRLVYVSCNPATQARDCALLASHYQVDTLQPVDMFPQTYHVENVAVLQRRS